MIRGSRHSKFNIAIAILIGIIFVFVAFGMGMLKNVDAGGSGDPIFYVGGSGAGNYTKIQDAIDNASSGDT